MKQHEVQQFIDRYLKGEATEKEEVLLQYWVLRGLNTAPATDENTDYPEVPSEIWSGIFGRTTNKKVNLWPRVGIVAAIATLLFGAGLFHFSKRYQIDGAMYANIKPVKAGATLTLANGKKIRLGDATNGELAKQSGYSVTKTADGNLIYEMKAPSGTKQGLAVINTLSTAMGETYKMTLPDSTRVWLNSESSITYAANLSECKERRIKLSGEAYFEVAKLRSPKNGLWLPFIVQTVKQEIQVLGTHFNISAYPDEPNTKTTLAEGSVKVNVYGEPVVRGMAGYLLVPGQQLVLSGSGARIQRANIEAELAWKNGDFIFVNEEFSSLMRKIGRWYNMEIIYEGSVPKMQPFTGQVSMSKNISAILHVLEESGHIHFKIEGRRIIITK